MFYFDFGRMGRYDISLLANLTQSALVKAGFLLNDAIIMTEVLMYAECRGNNQGYIYAVTKKTFVISLKD